MEPRRILDSLKRGYLIVGLAVLLCQSACARNPEGVALYPQPLSSPSLAEAREVLANGGIESHWRKDGQSLFVASEEASRARGLLTSAVLPRLGAPHQPVAWTDQTVNDATEALRSALLATEGMRAVRVRLSVPRGVPAVPSVRLLLEPAPECDRRKLAFGAVNTAQALVIGSRAESVELADLQGSAFPWWPKVSRQRLSDSDLVELLSGEPVAKLESALEEKLGCRVSVQLSAEVVFSPPDSLPDIHELAADLTANFSLAERCLSSSGKPSGSLALEFEYESRLARLARSARLQKRQVWVLVEAVSLEELKIARELAEQQLRIDRPSGEFLEAVEAEFEALPQP